MKEFTSKADNFHRQLTPELQKMFSVDLKTEVAHRLYIFDYSCFDSLETYTQTATQYYSLCSALNLEVLPLDATRTKMQIKYPEYLI